MNGYSEDDPLLRLNDAPVKQFLRVLAGSVLAGSCGRDQRQRQKRSAVSAV